LHGCWWRRCIATPAETTGRESQCVHELLLGDAELLCRSAQIRTPTRGICRGVQGILEILFGYTQFVSRSGKQGLIRKEILSAELTAATGTTA
jgi:hypothetical protein